MRRLYDHIQSPGALFAFEAAARHSSFTRAAAELNVSQPAISQSVKRIETALGVKLFERRRRTITLTEAGERFYADVSYGLMHILRSAEAIAIQRRSSHVTLSCSTAFAHYWIVPRLSDFKARHPEIEIRVQTTDRDIDLDGENLSLAIRRGDGDFPGYQAFRLAGESLYPVCSPAYLARNPAPERVEDLAHHALIHLEEPYRLRPTWEDWFRAQGVGYRDTGSGLRLNDYALVIQAAIEGEGVACGWRHLVAPLIEKGLLLRPIGGEYDAGQGFYILRSASRELSLEAATFLEWLKSEAE